MPRDYPRNPLSKLPTAEQFRRALAAARRIGTATKQRIALCGGLAMAAYGSRRVTYDVDVLVREVPRLRGAKPLSFGGVTVKVAGLPLDLIARRDRRADLYDEALSTAGPGKVHGVPVVRPEYLLAMKLDASRSKDADDVRFLLSEKKVDVSAARRLVSRVFGRDSQELEDLDAFVFETEHGGDHRRDRVRRRWRKAGRP